jgi:Protein of unknown function (DUF4232)
MFERFGLRGGAAVALVSAGAVLALAGCNAVTSQNGSAGGSTASASGAAQGGAAGGATVSPVAQGHGQGQGSTPECTLSDLAISLGAALPPGAPGISQRPIIMKNTGSAACFVVGWPGVAALDAGGAQIFQATRANAKGPQVTLQPGDSASAMLDTIAFHAVPGSSQAPCPTVPNLLVTPPDETHSARIAFGAPVCDPPTITSLIAGGAAQGAVQFAAARAQWVAGASAISAEQGAYWAQAASLLTSAVNAGEPGTAGFAQAAQELTQLGALPDAGLTPAQRTQEINLVAALNTFFSTPGLYS